MREYTPENPVFSDTIEITETSDPAHADVINKPLKQLQQNTMANFLLIAGLFGFSFDEDNETMINYMGCYMDEDTLYLPKAIVSLEEDETIRLTEGTSVMPYTPGGGGGGGYVLPAATNSRLGGVIIGDGLLVDERGRISVQIDEETAEQVADMIEANAEEPSDEQIDDLWNNPTEPSEEPETPEEPEEPETPENPEEPVTPEEPETPTEEPTEPVEEPVTD